MPPGAIRTLHGAHECGAVDDGGCDRITAGGAGGNAGRGNLIGQNERHEMTGWSTPCAISVASTVKPLMSGMRTSSTIAPIACRSNWSRKACGSARCRPQADRADQQHQRKRDAAALELGPQQIQRIAAWAPGRATREPNASCADFRACIKAIR